MIRRKSCNQDFLTDVKFKLWVRDGRLLKRSIEGCCKRAKQMGKKWAFQLFSLLIVLNQSYQDKLLAELREKIQVILFKLYETYALISNFNFNIYPQRVDKFENLLSAAEIQVHASFLLPFFCLCFEPFKGHFQSKLHFKHVHWLQGTH